MNLQAIVDIQRALDSAGVRFIVVGGLAVVAHGYLRVTRDADIVLELLPENIVRAFDALATIGYKPLVPITAAEFADPEKRRFWRETKQMVVLQFWSDRHRETKLDVFLEHPFDFAVEWSRARVDVIFPGESQTIRFVSVATLIRMKQEAGRPRDLDDIHHLEMLMEDEQ